MCLIFQCQKLDLFYDTKESKYASSVFIILIYLIIRFYLHCIYDEHNYKSFGALFPPQGRLYFVRHYEKMITILLKSVVYGSSI